MDKFATLEPVRLYQTATTTGSRLLGRGLTNRAPAVQHLIGRLPADLHILVLSCLAVPDIPAYARCSRVLAEFARDERVWERKWAALGVDTHRLGDVLDALEKREKQRPPPVQAPPDDEFGDFATGLSDGAANGFDSFFGAPKGVSLSLHPSVLSTKPSKRQAFIRVHALLKSFVPSLTAASHLVLSTLFPAPAPALLQQAQTLKLLSLFFSPAVKPIRNHVNVYASLRSAIDRFQANLLTAFDVADGKHDEAAMREVAYASLQVWEGHMSERRIAMSEWEMGRVWAEKKEIFYEQGQWRPLDNFTKDGGLDFDAMDEFMTHVLESVQTNGATAVRVFPPDSEVLLSFADRIAVDVIGEYITPLLTKAREFSNETFLKATAATFREALRMVDVLVQLNDVQSGADKKEIYVTRTKAEDVIFRMFEPNMDEYLDEEIDSLKQALEVINREWEKKIAANADTSAASSSNPTQARFLGSHNPAQMKRTVLASFTDVLLLPVTIVPRTVGAVGAALTTGGTVAVQGAVAGIAMLNPQRWTQGSGATGQGYSRDFEKGDREMLFEVGEAEDEQEGAPEKDAASWTRSSLSSASRTTLDVPPPSSAATSVRSTSPTRSHTPSTTNANASTASFDKLELLLSLDVALELIHASREALKRVETFAGYPGTYGHRVRDTIEEIFILLLQAVGERHISPGFERATEQMRTYKPAEHEETASVAPLMQFFELVHVGDTIQSMVQVYFEKELAPHIDKTDFLNAVVREKKRFENILDDSVAAGMNAGTEVLMNQVEHIILTRTKAREYYPPEDAPLDLRPTQGCTEAIACLDMHCKLLKGSTSKEVLEVFHQEVGIRLLAILHRHIKRQIISLQGGFQVIADFNVYHSFISSLKVPSVAADFSNLKMLGHVYVVEDAKDLAQIVRDVTRYGGAYRPEDIYEFIQRRADWKKIEKIVDKTMYNLSFKEDCIVC